MERCLRDEPCAHAGYEDFFALNETGGRGVFLGSVTCSRLMEFNETPALEAESKACGGTVREDFSACHCAFLL